MGTKRLRASGRRLFVALLLCGTVGAQTGRAQVATSLEGAVPAFSTNMYGIGLFAGYASGVGLSFRHHLPGRFSYQVTGGVIKSRDEVWYTIGGEGQFDFARSRTYRVYAAIGAGYYYEGSSGQNTIEGPTRIGLGIGGEIVIGGQFTVLADLLFTYFSDDTILPLPQAGIYYYFD